MRIRRRTHHPPATPAALIAKVRPDYRRGICSAFFALVAIVCGHVFAPTKPAHGVSWIALVCALGFVVFGVTATRLVANEAARVSTLRAGTTAATGPIRVVLLLVGYAIVGLVAFDLLDLPLGHLLVGGAITGIIVGIAAQQSLGNLFAGLVLLFVRPYVPGERVIIRSGALNGPLMGTITVVGLLYTTLAMEDGPSHIPNSALLAAAVGPAPAEDEGAANPASTTAHESGLTIVGG